MQGTVQIGIHRPGPLGPGPPGPGAPEPPDAPLRGTKLPTASEVTKLPRKSQLSDPPSNMQVPPPPPEPHMGSDVKLQGSQNRPCGLIPLGSTRDSGLFCTYA